MKVLVCGGRNYDNEVRVYAVLESLLALKPPITHLIHGGAQGADALAGKWADGRKIPCTVYPADWINHGRSAGPVRNAQMLREGKPDTVVAFPGGKGTAHMVMIARKAGVTVMEVTE